MLLSGQDITRNRCLDDAKRIFDENTLQARRLTLIANKVRAERSRDALVARDQIELRLSKLCAATICAADGLYARFARPLSSSGRRRDLAVHRLLYSGHMTAGRAARSANTSTAARAAGWRISWAATGDVRPAQRRTRGPLRGRWAYAHLRVARKAYTAARSIHQVFAITALDGPGWVVTAI